MKYRFNMHETKMMGAYELSIRRVNLTLQCVCTNINLQGGKRMNRLTLTQGGTMETRLTQLSSCAG